MRNNYYIYIVKEDNFTNYKIINHEYLDDISISVNDKEYKDGIDYTIVDSEVFFTLPLSIGDKIILSTSISVDVKIFSKNSYSRNVLFKLYNSIQKLKNNYSYEFCINVDNEEYKTVFNTKYDPFYVSIKKIRTDTGDLLNSVSDEIIANVIYSNSKYAFDKIAESDIDLSEGVPKYAREYVRYKTCIDFCYSVYISITGKVGSTSKIIGDMEISTTVKLPYINDMIGRFKELLKKNEELLDGENSAVISSSFVKAESSEYPVSNRGVF